MMEWRDLDGENGGTRASLGSAAPSQALRPPLGQAEVATEPETRVGLPKPLRNEIAILHGLSPSENRGIVASLCPEGVAAQNTRTRQIEN